MRQPSEASVKPKLMSAAGNSLTRCTSLFICSQYDFDSVVIRQTLRTLFQIREGSVFSDATVPYVVMRIYCSGCFYVDCKRGENKREKKNLSPHPVSSYCLRLLVPLHPLSYLPSHKACRFVPLPRALVTFIIEGVGTF